jgi:hypothetical protein
MIRRPLTVAAVSVAGLLAFAACGSESEPVVKAVAPAPQYPTPFQVYYDLTHPDVAQVRTPSPFQVYYEQTHPDFGARPRRPVLHLNTGDAKDHAGYGSVQGRHNGDAKDHLGYGPVQEQFNGDAKDHPSRLIPALRAPAPSVLQLVAEFAESEGLTGLSPAFLQPAPVQK